MRAVIVGCLAAVLAASASAQVQIDITRELDRRTPIAVPDFVTAPGNEALGAELAEVIRYDLEFTGLFQLLDRSQFPPSFTGFTSDASTIDFAAWRATGAEFLVYAYVTVQGAEISAECRLFDLIGSQQVVGKRFVADNQWQRSLAHRFSDEIVLFLTGEPGIATSQIAFSGGQTGSKEIYVVDYDGAGLRKVTDHASGSGKPISTLPEFSPDGKRIAYLSYKDRYPFLYILDLPTGASSPLSKNVGLNTSPAWHPSGSQLAIVLSQDANNEIYVVSQDGSSKRRITNDRSVDASPVFSPDGGQIAFVSDRQGSAQVFVMGADGSGAHRVSFHGGKGYEPDWSPNGRLIAFVGESSGEGHEVYVMNADGTNPRRLTSSSGSNESPSFSADSRHIVFASTRGGRSELWTVNVETGEERRVPGVNLSSQAPSWGPRR